MSALQKRQTKQKSKLFLCLLCSNLNKTLSTIIRRICDYILTLSFSREKIVPYFPVASII